MDTLILTLQLFTSLPIKKNVEVSDERLIRGVALWLSLIHIYVYPSDYKGQRLYLFHDAVSGAG